MPLITFHKISVIALCNNQLQVPAVDILICEPTLIYYNSIIEHK